MLCMKLSRGAEKNLRGFLAECSTTFPLVFSEVLSALLVPNLLLSISFSVSKPNLLDTTKSLQVPGVKSFSPQTEHIRHLQTLLVGNFFSFLTWEHFKVQAWFCSVVSISKTPFHSIPSCKSTENGSLVQRTEPVLFHVHLGSE